VAAEALYVRGGIQIMRVPRNQPLAHANTSIHTPSMYILNGVFWKRERREAYQNDARSDEGISIDVTIVSLSPIRREAANQVVRLNQPPQESKSAL